MALSVLFTEELSVQKPGVDTVDVFHPSWLPPRPEVLGAQLLEAANMDLGHALEKRNVSDTRK